MTIAKVPADAHGPLLLPMPGDGRKPARKWRIEHGLYGKVGAAKIAARHLHTAAEAGFASALVTDMDTYLVGSGLVVGMVYCIVIRLAGIIADAGIAAVAEVPADLLGPFTVVMPGYGNKYFGEWRGRRQAVIEISPAAIGHRQGLQGVGLA